MAEAKQVYKVRLGNIVVGYEVSLTDEDRIGPDDAVAAFCDRTGHDASDVKATKIYEVPVGAARPKPQEPDAGGLWPELAPPFEDTRRRPE